jgi:cysteine desulfurase / selenocysteine lyase
MNKTTFPVEAVRAEFPILQQKVYGRPLVYFDNAASTQKPRQVIDAIRKYYEEENCNIHRGLHYLSVNATEAYEGTRCEVKHFIHARHAREIIFTKGTTESLNLVASSFAAKFLNPGDEVITTVMEHHSNFVPWQQVCLQKGATLRVIPINDRGELILEEYKKLISGKTKIVAVTQISNVLGTINPVKEIIDYAHQYNIPVLVDGAQGVSHLNVNVTELDCDFYCFSGHKMYGPMGIGVLYGKEQWLDALPPYQLGGEMIKDVFLDHTTFNSLPFKFEAGTPNVEGVIGLRAAMKYIEQIGMENIAAYEKQLLDYATEKMLAEGDIKIYGTAPEKASLISFLMDKVHPYDAGSIIDKFGIALRTGHHCAMPLIDSFNIPGTIRASFSFYNTFEEIDRLMEALQKVRQLFTA